LTHLCANQNRCQNHRKWWSEPDEGLPLVVSVVADDAKYFMNQHPKVFYAHNLECPIMLMGLCIQCCIHFHLCAQGLYQRQMIVPYGQDVNLLNDRRTRFFWLVEHYNAGPTLSMRLGLGEKHCSRRSTWPRRPQQICASWSAEISPTQTYFPSVDNSLRDFTAPARCDKDNLEKDTLKAAQVMSSSKTQELRKEKQKKSMRSSRMHISAYASTTIVPYYGTRARGHL